MFSCWDASSRRCSVRSGGRKMKANTQSFDTDRNPTTSWFPCCFPPYSFYQCNQYSCTPHAPLLSHFLHFTVWFIFHHLHLRCSTNTWRPCLLNRWFVASWNGKFIKPTTPHSVCWQRNILIKQNEDFRGICFQSSLALVTCSSVNVKML